MVAVTAVRSSCSHLLGFLPRHVPQISVAVGGEQEENAALRTQSEDLSCRLKKSEAAVMKLTYDVKQLRACFTLDAHPHPTKLEKEKRVQVHRLLKRNTTVDVGI